MELDPELKEIARRRVAQLREDASLHRIRAIAAETKANIIAHTWEIDERDHSDAS